MTNACQNRKFSDTVLVQDGWTEDGRRIMREMPFAMTKSCQYQRDTDDPGCVGCKEKE